MSFLTLEFAISFLKVLNIDFPLILISLNVVERSLLLWMTSVIVGANGKMLNLMLWRNGRLTFFKIIDTCISFYSRNTHLLPPKPKSSFSHLKRGIQDFHMNYVLVPADKAANNVVVVWRLYYINTLKRELVDTNAYKLQPSLSERVIVDGHGCHTALHFGVKAKENQDKVPTLYWLPKLHKNPIKQDLLQIIVLVQQQNFLNC